MSSSTASGKAKYQAPADKNVADQSLIAASLQGDRQAFCELVSRYRNNVVNVVYHMVGDMPLAEEAAQEAFLRAWQRLDTYQPRYPFKNWVISIAVHHALDQLRGKPQVVDVDQVTLAAPGDRPEAELESKERVEAVRQAVLELPPACRAVLILREYEGLSYQEISSSLSIPLGTVMSRLNYARSQLRQSLAAFLEK